MAEKPNGGKPGPKQKETALVVPQTEYAVVLQGDPEKQIEYARKAATALMEIIKQKPKKVMINGEQYLEFEDWQILGRFYGASVGNEWTKVIEREGRIIGYEARAVVYLKGEIISAAEAICTRDEKNWANRDEFAIKSMAQTRAAAKSLRNVLAWVAILAGFKPTPAEEMEGSAEVQQQEQDATFETLMKSVKKASAEELKMFQEKMEKSEKYKDKPELKKRFAEAVVARIAELKKPAGPAQS